MLDLLPSGHRERELQAIIFVACRALGFNCRAEEPINPHLRPKPRPKNRPGPKTSGRPIGDKGKGGRLDLFFYNQAGTVPFFGEEVKPDAPRNRHRLEIEREQYERGAGVPVGTICGVAEAKEFVEAMVTDYHHHKATKDNWRMIRAIAAAQIDAGKADFDPKLVTRWDWPRPIPPEPPPRPYIFSPERPRYNFGLPKRKGRTADGRWKTTF